MSLSNRKVKLAFGSTIITLLMAGGMSYRAITVSAGSEHWVQHTHEVLENLQKLLEAVQSVESAYREFALTGDASHLESYHAIVASVAEHEIIVRSLTIDNLKQQRQFSSLDGLIAQEIQIGETVIGLRETTGLDRAADAARARSGQKMMEQIQASIRDMQNEEFRLLVVRNADAKRRLERTKAVLIFGTIIGIVIATGAGWTVRRYDFAERGFAEKALREGEDRFRTLANNMSQLAWMADEKGSIFWYNDRWFDYTGTNLENLSGSGWRKVHHPDHVQRVVDNISQSFETGEAWEDTFPLRDRHGNYRWFLSRAVPLRDPKGKISRWFGTNTDINDSKVLEEALFLEKERAQVTLNSIADAVACTDAAGNISFLNLVAERMTGWSHEEATGRPLADVFPVIDSTTRKPVPAPREITVAQDIPVTGTGNHILLRRDGSEAAVEDSSAPIRDQTGRLTGAVIVFHDVTASRAMSLQMVYSAQHDTVTNLPNRMLLNDRITQSISLARRNNRSIAVLFLDLDHFKYINDSLGHAVGDQLLQSVSSRLQGTVRRSDTVSRLGGDEFVILLSELSRPDDAATSAKKILLVLSAPCSIAGHDLHIDGSIGVSLYPADGEDAETLIQNADTAMYHAKEHGRNNFEFFTPEMNLKAVHRQSLESNLHRAVERDEFLLHYQPKVSLVSGEITGVEALIRWHHPDRGLISPAQFVPIAEDCGLILPIGRWVLREACRQACEWQAAGLPFRRISVNVSAMEFRNRGFAESVATILAETCFDPRRLDLELTEGVLMADVESTGSILHALKAMGIHLAVDDFGTGYSSLSYLRRFPIDVLKIDQSFVREITDDPEDATIVSAIIEMGKNLKRRVIAEGIETRKQLAFLQDHQCAEGQGYLFSKPLDAEKLAHLLQVGITEAVSH